MRYRRFAMSMSLASGLALLGVSRAQAVDSPQPEDCVAYAGLNLDAVAGKSLDELVQCHDILAHALDCHDGDLASTQCSDAWLKDLNAKRLRQLNVALANDERALRRQANELSTANETRKALINNLSTPTGGSPKNNKAGREEQKSTASDQIASANADLKTIESRVAYSEKKLFVNSEDYEDYFFRLNTGYEYVALDKLFSTGTPRISLLVNSKLGGESINDRVIGPHFYGVRLNISALLNSSAEVTSKFPTDTPATSKVTDTAASTDSSDVKKTLELDLQAVVPFFRTRLFTPNNLRTYFSIVTTVGGLKTDAQSQITKRYYGGLRVSINPELYEDFLIGRTEGLKSLRFEYRGQLPVYTLASGDRIFLGTIINLGLDKKEANESDVFRVYVSWNTDLKKLFSGNQSS